ncbi:MAG: carboxylesterase/lipase family protein [Myxococcota bacterium]|jgi:para-nitrobenzyl esterase
MRFAEPLLAIALISLVPITAATGCASKLPVAAQSLGRGIQRVMVDTKSGPVAGMQAKDGLVAFFGIPYAKPPVGNLRFAPPQEPSRWDNAYPAFSYGAVCPQSRTRIDPVSQSYNNEDCLSLNVWTPGADSAGRPVLVFIHGGAFFMGASASSWFDGSNFARRGDIVVVTINYRLGALGFLYGDNLPGFAAGSGNLGLQDQVAALRWVRDNIAKFGGNPGQVTIMGESAGSMSVTSLMAIPSAKGLFSRVIAESGAPTLSRDIKAAEATTGKFMAQTGATDLAALRALTVTQILDAQSKMFAEARFGAERMFTPVIDGQFLPKDPMTAIAGGSAAGISLLNGTNSDEFRFWLYIDPRIALVSPDMLLGFAPDLAAKLGDSRARIIKFYRDESPDLTRGQVAMELATDMIFWMPHIALSEAQAKHGRTWMYLFSWKTPKEGGKYGAHHGLELPFVFYNHKQKGSEVFFGDKAPERLADDMNEAWISFIRTGDPQYRHLPEWPAYDTEKRATMIFDTKSAVVDDPRRDFRLVWKGVLY